MNFTILMNVPLRMPVAINVVEKGISGPFPGLVIQKAQETFYTSDIVDGGE